MFSSLFPKEKPLIGMIHLAALPGYPTHPGMDELINRALFDLQTLEAAGFDGALVENDNDQPHTVGVSDAIASAFAEAMNALLKKSSIPVGMEIIYDAKKTINVAHTVGSPFIRLDVFVDSVNTKWGVIDAQAKTLMELKNSLDPNIVVLADVQVKHATMVEDKSLSVSSKDSIAAGADGLIITGDWTGIPPSVSDCIEAKKAAGNIPILIGSGFSDTNAKELLKTTDGAIVGTSIKKDGLVNKALAERLENAVNEIRLSL